MSYNANCIPFAVILKNIDTPFTVVRLICSVRRRVTRCKVLRSNTHATRQLPYSLVKFPFRSRRLLCLILPFLLLSVVPFNYLSCYNKLCGDGRYNNFEQFFTAKNVRYVCLSYATDVTFLAEIVILKTSSGYFNKLTFVFIWKNQLCPSISNKA